MNHFRDAANLMADRAFHEWDDDRLRDEIGIALKAAYEKGQEDGDCDCSHDDFDEDCPGFNEDGIDAGQALVLQIGRIKEIRAGIILDACLNDELDKLIDMASEKAEKFGLVA